MSQAQQETIPLGAYICARLRQLEIGSVFGVPGDYNLRILDYIEPAGLRWIGNCNELNAAYAADGYARIHGVSVVMTTFGVGELSAINGIAGAYAERAPVIQIVGAPSREIQRSRTLVHHTFIDGEFGRFARMHVHVTVAQTSITHVRTAADQVDWIIEQAILHQRPVYLQIPEDMPDVPVSASNLRRKPTVSPSIHSVEPDANHVLQILNRMYSAKKPLILVDGESKNMGALEEIEQLVKVTNWPTWSTPFGKGLVNEELPNVRGTYLANYGVKASAEYFMTSDLVLFLGPHLSNINTHIFTAIPDENVTISFSPNQVKIDGQIIRDISPCRMLQSLLQCLDSSRLVKISGPNSPTPPIHKPAPSDSLSQEIFYPFVNPMFRRGDTILTETGTAAEGGQVFKLPSHTRFFTAVTWLSIGYMLPATLGAALAQRDSAIATHCAEHKPKRTILFIGDGSFQMTAQELSTIIKQVLNVVIIIINNNGYTIERVIHGREASYNDISQWNYSHALRLFGLDEEESSRRYFSARTWGELQTALDSEELHRDDGVKVIEVFMDQEDCTGELRDLLKEQLAREKL
ncbi:pyruvate decarboxylase [Aspergillus steynii IBT 23096]|uniref:Pyruvate decarboxylase n=1 Tax=Aspergillus steynii IBT 23096 TaxID=1392250 RepID=A0A2I2GDG3_9EURO|nr:pyruvate decarboxylase [Aspergillus steynii IBT 23096]PLB50881.1 pyruvate decarboxylase [Aspergillus steynii IBT 23096]